MTVYRRWFVFIAILCLCAVSEMAFVKCMNITMMYSF